MRSLARNVVLISVDTLRADRLGSYGYARPTSPNIDALARRSVVFENAYAQASQTAPSHASLFTSSYPGAHGIVNVHGDHAAFPTLPPGSTTLAECLAANGLETVAYVSGGNLTKHMHVNRGFAQWSERNDGAKGRVDAFLEWIQGGHERPFFALVHTYEVHAPYVPRRELADAFTDGRYNGPLRARLERYLALPADEAWRGGVGADYWEGMLDYSAEDVRFLSDLYDAEVAVVDGELRRLLEVLLVGPRAADTAIILVADHGEEFREHGKFQHDQVFEELLRVPLIIRLPTSLEKAGWRGRISERVQLIDVAPTVVDLLGIDTRPETWRGRSLLKLLDPATRAATAVRWPEPIYSELTVDPGPKLYRTVNFGGWKYIHVYQRDLDVTWEYLFDLEADPGEGRNLMQASDPASRERLGQLRKLLEARTEADRRDRSVLGGVGSESMNAESREALKALGYIGDEK